MHQPRHQHRKSSVVQMQNKTKHKGRAGNSYWKLVISLFMKKQLLETGHFFVHEKTVIGNWSFLCSWKNSYWKLVISLFMKKQLLETGHFFVHEKTVIGNWSFLCSWKNSLIWFWTIYVLVCVLVVFCPRMNNLITYKYVIIQSDTMQYNFIAKRPG